MTIKEIKTAIRKELIKNYGWEKKDIFKLKAENGASFYFLQGAPPKGYAIWYEDRSIFIVEINFKNMMLRVNCEKAIAI